MTTIRYLARESPRSFLSPTVDANNNTDEDDDDSNDEDSAENNRPRMNLAENVVVDSSTTTTTVAAPTGQLRKTVSFEDVVEELSQRQEVARGGKQVCGLTSSR